MEAKECQIFESAREAFSSKDYEEKKFLHFIVANKLTNRTSECSRTGDETMKELQKNWSGSVLTVDGIQVKFTPDSKVLCVECDSPSEFQDRIKVLREESKQPLPNLMYLDFMVPDNEDTVYHIYLEEDERTKEADEVVMLAAKHIIDLGFPAIVLCSKDYAAKHFPEATFFEK